MIIGIYGTGGTAKDVYDIVIRQKQYEKVIFIDDMKEAGTFRECEMYPFHEIPRYYNPQNMRIVITAGEPPIRKKLYDKVKMQGYTLASVIHENADISKTALTGEGLIAFKDTIIRADVRLDENILLEPSVMVAHDVCIGKHTVLSCRAAIGGYAYIGESVYIALASAVRDRIKIGDKTIIGMGSIVVKDLPEKVVAFGCPACIIRKNEGEKIFKSKC